MRLFMFACVVGAARVGVEVVAWSAVLGDAGCVSFVWRRVRPGHALLDPRPQSGEFLGRSRRSARNDSMVKTFSV